MSRGLSEQATGTGERSLALLVERITNQFQAGEAVQLAELQQQHPEHAEQLAQFWPALQALAELECPSSTGSGSEVLGDFCILREVGRGGMGVVYEALQRSLARRVALKVLPFAAALDERRQQRFKNEAQAAAGLHHSNIVPVYAVGCERGVHYYAMQFIEGQSLAWVLGELRREAGLVGKEAAAAAGPGETPAPAGLVTERSGRGRTYYRKVAELGVQAAQALEHAHQRGVIHRDIKPANLLVDERGVLWVTDFGVAHLQHAEASLTLSGDVVGTLRYMSPEQAAGSREPVDPRSDVYSLGATLYELLTLRPVFAATAQQELLRQVSFEEPVAPRRLERGIPLELQTIVLKALEKRPAGRYATAGELAEDLQRFLEDRPIRARRPSLAQVAAKWARRHRPVVAAVAVFLLVLAVLAGVLGVGWAQQRSIALAEVQAALQEADRLREQEKWPEGLDAVARARRALDGLGRSEWLREQVAERERDLGMAQQLEQAQLRFMGQQEGPEELRLAATACLEAFSEYGIDVENGDPQQAGEDVSSRPIRKQLVAALDFCVRVGGRRPGGDTESWKHLLTIAHVADPDGRRNLIIGVVERRDPEAVLKLGRSKQASGLPPATQCLLGDLLWTLKEREQAVTLLRLAQRQQPGDFWINMRLGRYCCEAHHPRDAVRFFTAAVALRPRSAGAHTNLGNALRLAGKLDEAIDCQRKAIDLNRDYAPGHSNLAATLWDKGKREEGIACFRQAIRIDPKFAAAHFNLGLALLKQRRLEEAITEFQEAIRTSKEFAEAHNHLGVALAESGKQKAAIAAYREAIRLDKDYTQAHYNLGNALRQQGKLDEAITAFREAIRSNKDYAPAHHNLGIALKARGQLAQAIIAYREAIRLDRGYAQAHYNLGNALAARGELGEAIASYREAIRLNGKDARAHCALGFALGSKGQVDEAIGEFRQAIRLDKDDADAHINLGIALERKGRFREAAAAFRRAHQLGGNRPNWPHPSAAWARQAEQMARLAVRLPAVLQGKDRPRNGKERLAFASLCLSYRKQYATAVHFYHEAFAAQAGLLDDLEAAHRYNAACAAALAGTGQGNDGRQLAQGERARLRQQAREWLLADLQSWRRRLEEGGEQTRTRLVKTMESWQQDSDLAGVRGTAALNHLPQAERAAWQQLWTEVADLLRRARARVAPVKSSSR